MTHYDISHSEVDKLIMGYLREKGYLESLSSLQLESNVGEGQMDEELLYLQKLTLQGRWSDTLRYLAPMRRVLLHNFEMLEFMIKKQQYLEALSWLGAGGQKHALMPWKPSKRAMRSSDVDSSLNMQESSVILDEDDLDMDALAELLKDLEAHCSRKEFNHLCDLMALESLADDARYAAWSVTQGRLECFQSMRELLWKVLPGDNSADTSEERAMRLGGLMTVCESALELQLQQELAEAQGLASSLRTLDGATDTKRAPIARPGRARGVLQGGKLMLDQGSYTAEVSKYNLQATTSASVEVDEHKSAEPTTQTRALEQRLVSGAASFGIATSTPTSPEPTMAFATATAATAEVRVDEIERPLSLEVETASRQELAQELPASTVEEDTVEEDEQAQKSPIHGLKDIITDEDNGIEIHVPRTRPGQGALLSPVRKSPGGESQNILGRGGSRGYEDPRAPSRGSPTHGSVAWTLDMGGERAREKGVGHVYSPSRRSPRTREKDSPDRGESAADNGRKGGKQTKKAKAAAAVTQYAQSKSIARLREASDESSSVQSAVVGSGRERPTMIPPPLPATVAKNAIDQLGPPPLPAQRGHPHGHPHLSHTPNDDNNSVYSGQYSTSDTVTIDVDARTTLSTVGNATATTAGGATIRSMGTSSVVTAGAGTVAPAGGWPMPQSPSLSQRDPPTVALGNHQANIGSAAFAAHVHAKWLGLAKEKNDSSHSPRQLSSRVLLDAGCPLRCIKAVGLYADRDEPEKKEVELLVGSNNKSVTLLRTQASSSSETHDMQRSPHSGTYIQREWIDAHRGSVYCLDYAGAKTKIFATGSNDKSVRMGKADSPLLSPPLKGHTGTVRVVSFSPSLAASSGRSEGGASLQLLASGGAGDCKPRLWDVNTGSSHSVLTGHSACVHGLCWLDGVTLLSGCESGAIIAHDLRMSGAAWRFNLPSPVCTLLSIDNTSNDPASAVIAAGGIGGVISLFNARSGHIYASNRVHGDDVRCLAAMPAPVVPQKGFSGVSKLPSKSGLPVLVSSSFDGTASMWRLHQNHFAKIGASTQSHQNHGARSPGGSKTSTIIGSPQAMQRLICLQGAAMAFSVPSSTPQNHTRTPYDAKVGHIDKVLGACVVPWTQSIVTTGADGKIIHWGMG